jgi:hypothetical protein
MASWIGIGHASLEENPKAAEEAAVMALKNAQLPEGQPVDLVLLFCSSLYPQTEIVESVYSTLYPKILVGCSSAGEIISSGPLKRSIIVLLFSSDRIAVTAGFGESAHENPRQAGQRASFMAVQGIKKERHAFLIFPDGLAGNGSDILRGCQEALGTSFLIVGGSAADDYSFKKTFQFFQDKVLTNSVVGALFGGEVSVGIGGAVALDAELGKPRKVTKSYLNRVDELDGSPAANLYAEYFGSVAEELKQEFLARLTLAYPLGVSIIGEEEYLLRNVLRVDPATGALIYSADIPEQSHVRLMMSSRETILSSASRAAVQSLNCLNGKKPLFALVFNSVARKKLLRFQAKEEVQTIQQALGESVPLAGFYSYGEQAPLGAAMHRGQSHFHNESVVVVTVAENS